MAKVGGIVIDLKYHIYSLAAVFFALAIGIVVGASFAKKLPGNDNDRQTVLRYENSMRILKREIEEASEGAAQKEQLAKDCQEFCRTVLPTVANGRLTWRNVAIVRTGDYDDLSGSVKSALELAGARVTSVVDISREFQFGDRDRVAEVLRTCGVTVPDTATEAKAKLFAIIAQAVLDGQYPFTQSALDESGAARFALTNHFHKTRLVVLVGGASSDRSNTSGIVDTVLIEALRKPDVTIVGCEGSGAAVSYVPTWSKLGIATVDNADSPMGQIALVCALGGEKARFGTKETAERLIPKSLEAE